MTNPVQVLVLDRGVSRRSLFDLGASNNLRFDNCGNGVAQLVPHDTPPRSPLAPPYVTPGGFNIVLMPAEVRLTDLARMTARYGLELSSGPSGGLRGVLRTRKAATP